MTGPRRCAVAAVVVLAGLALRPVPTEAQLFSCTISTTSVAFGSYSVFSSLPAESAGSVRYNCTIGLFIAVELDTGSSGSYASRTLDSGSDTIDYNLYLDSGYSTVWGDGSGGTGRITHLISIFANTRQVYGRIPALQDVMVGDYSDSVTATIIW